MSEMKRIVCLANSRKLQGRCIAGRERIGDRVGPWIRPVSAREHEEVSERERQYRDGSDPQVLDVIDVPLLSPRPKDFQIENWLLDPDTYWDKVGTAKWKELAELTDPVGPLWINGHQTYHGVNDQIPLIMAKKIRTSLRLIRVPSVQLSVLAPSAKFGNPKRRVQANFPFGGFNYGLWVTDPKYESAYLARPDGDYSLGESYLTISLGEPFNDQVYKLVATIIPRDAGAAL